eukprot:g31302.t1
MPGTRRNRDAATGKRAISLEEIAFLDSWNVEPRPEVAEMEDTEMEPEAKRVLSVDLSLPGQAKQTGTEEPEVAKARVAGR